MKAILIKRPLTEAEIAEVLALAREGGCNIVAYVDLPPSLQAFSKNGSGIPEAEKKSINYSTMDMVLAFGDKVIEGRAVAEWMAFENSSLWYYHKFRAYFRLRNMRYEIAEIRKLAEENEQVIAYASDSLLCNAAFPANVRIVGPARKKKKGKDSASIISYLFILKARWLINLFSWRKLRKPVHILMDVTKRQAFLDMQTLKARKGNYVIGYMLERAGSDFLIIDEAVQPKMSGGAGIRPGRDSLFGKGSLRRRYFGEPILLNYFLSAKLRKRKKALLRSINEGIEAIKPHCSEDERLLLDIYRSFGGATNFYLIKYLAYRRFFNRHRFSTITSVDENSPAIRSILDAARASGIHTIGMQHGNLHDLHPAYRYTSADSKRRAFPDSTIVWGPYWKEFLIEKGNYPSGSMMVGGQVRTDIIPLLKTADIAKSAVVKEIRDDEQLIVFASQPQRDPELREQAALDMMAAAKAIPGTYLLIKLHPNEKDDAGYYEKLALKTGLRRYGITLSVDLYLLISVCDILITCFTTVGTETVYFGKPLIVLDHLGQDIQHYHREGVALQATGAKSLEGHIRDILSGKRSIDRQAYERFISKYAFVIDGKASERAMGFIREKGRWKME
jgi:hypothetical protein